MAAVRTHYDNLKVPRDASTEAIRRAYKSLSQRYHPDKCGSDPEAERIFKIINRAYHVLRHPDSRREHDAWIDAQSQRLAQAQLRLARRRSGSAEAKATQPSSRPQRSHATPASAMQRRRRAIATARRQRYQRAQAQPQASAANHSTFSRLVKGLKLVVAVAALSTFVLFSQWTGLDAERAQEPVAAQVSPSIAPSRLQPAAVTLDSQEPEQHDEHWVQKNIF